MRKRMVEELMIVEKVMLVLLEELVNHFSGSFPEINKILDSPRSEALIDA